MNPNKDWIGNGASVFRAIAASNHSVYEREPTDFYATDPKALEIFLVTIKRDGFILPHKICEPACGMGHLSEVLKSHGYEVDSYDLHNHGYGKICSLRFNFWRVKRGLISLKIILQNLFM